MAQIPEEKRAVMERARFVVRQRPATALAMTLVLGLLFGAGSFGVLAAQGIGGAEEGMELTRDGKADRVDDAERNDEADDTSKDETGSRETVVVDVSGAVASPAVVELEEGSRVQDAIEAAGGLAADADISALNRAAVCADGQKVYVPRQGEAVPVGEGSSTQTTGADAGSALVNINSADEVALDGLPGVGPSTAQAIIEDREANGAFSSIEDLMRVSGIGEKKFEKLKNDICV